MTPLEKEMLVTVVLGIAAGLLVASIAFITGVY